MQHPCKELEAASTATSSSYSSVDIQLVQLKLPSCQPCTRKLALLVAHTGQQQETLPGTQELPLCVGFPRQPAYIPPVAWAAGSAWCS
jgi:hypothetical protein